MPKQVFLAHFEPEITVMAYGKGQNALKRGRCGTKNGSKTCFSKSDPRPFGMLKQVFLARFELLVMHCGPWRMPKCLENGPFWGQKCVKNGAKQGVFPKVILDHLVCTNK